MNVPKRFASVRHYAVRLTATAATAARQMYSYASETDGMGQRIILLCDCTVSTNGRNECEYHRNCLESFGKAFSANKKAKRLAARGCARMCAYVC